jgi:hypothetical protein
MKFFTINNTMNWQAVNINLSKINTLHIVNIYLTVENEQLAVIFKLGNIVARRDNKIVCENSEESLSILAWIVNAFPYLSSAFPYIIERFPIFKTRDIIAHEIVKAIGFSHLAYAVHITPYNAYGFSQEQREDRIAEDNLFYTNKIKAQFSYIKRMKSHDLEIEFVDKD